ncbi:MAG TPA: signal peptidase I [Polyangia bacterium]|nr:signal peptidase I [Polyangia bacterium]
MKRLGWIIVPIILVAGGLAFFGLDFPRLSSNDMAPTLRKGDLVLACRVCGALDRGDVVLFSPPEKPGELQFRRVVAIPGDKVEVRKGRVLVNGAPLVAEDGGTVQLDLDGLGAGAHNFRVNIESTGAHRYRVLRDFSVPDSGDRAAETLADSYFLLADRRTLAADSREFGPVPRSRIRSRALRVLSAGDSDAARQTRLP